MSSPQEIFIEMTGRLDYPMLLVTTVADGERAGCLVGFSTQCSIDPPRFIACLSDKNRTQRVASRADALAVHFLPAGATGLARLFGSETGDDVDKFAQCRWHTGPSAYPSSTNAASGSSAGSSSDSRSEITSRSSLTPSRPATTVTPIT